MFLHNTYSDAQLLKELRVKHDATESAQSTSLTSAQAHDLPSRPFSARTEPSDHRVVLYVGDCVYRTSTDTLCCIDGSRFPELLRDVAKTSAGWQLTIDRDGEMFGYILDYLRATSSGLGSLAPLPCEDHAVRLLDEARFYRIPGLIAQMQHSAQMSPLSSAQRGVIQNNSGSAPFLLRFANAYAVVTGSKPTFSKAQMQQLTCQINMQTSVLQKQGFLVKDISSGMDHNKGNAQEAYSLYINVLMASTTSAAHDAAGAGCEPSQGQLYFPQVPLAKATFAQTAATAQSHRVDPLPELRQRLNQSTAELSKPAQSEMPAAFDPATPPQDACLHRPSQLLNRCSDPIACCSPHEAGRQTSLPTGNPIAQSKPADVVNSNLAAEMQSVELDWQARDHADPFASFDRQCNLGLSPTDAIPNRSARSDGSAQQSADQAVHAASSSSCRSQISTSSISNCCQMIPADVLLRLGQSHSMQHQVFDDLFDTRQSSFMTSQYSAAEPCTQLGIPTDTRSMGQMQPMHCEVEVSLQTSSSLPSTSGGTSASLHQLQHVNYSQADADSASDSSACACSTHLPRLAGTAQVALVQPRPDQSGTASRIPSQDLSSGVRIVSTSHLEIMGWDLFADTLGTFQLLSDSASEAASERSLPEPNDFGPMTPGAGVHEPKSTPQCAAADTPFMHTRHEVSLADSQDLSAFDDHLPDLADQQYELVHSQDKEHNCIPHQHKSFAYVALASPRTTVECKVASSQADQHRMQPGRQLNCHLCGCYGFLRQRKCHERLSFRDRCTRFYARRKACLYPCGAQDDAM